MSEILKVGVQIRTMNCIINREAMLEQSAERQNVITVLKNLGKLLVQKKYRTLKDHKHFTSIEPLLSSKLPLTSYINSIPTNGKSNVIFNTDRLETMNIYKEKKWK